MKSKKWLALLLSAAMIVPVAVAGCTDGGGEGEGGDGGTNPPALKNLSAPEVTLNGNVLSWTAVENAESYTVYIIENGQRQIVSEQTGLTYRINKTVAGDYQYYVVAHNSTLNIKSTKSITVTYTMAPDTSTKFTGNIYLVGDSTVCEFADSYYLPRYGYGTQLYNYINCEPSQIKNLALSGRSSKSFVAEGTYSALTGGLKEGDYLIIGFGHNDEKSDDADRFTSAKGDKDTAGSFQNSLYVNYVKLAKDKGATPILCTPIVRYDETGSYTGAKVHVTADGDYAQAIKDLGAVTDTTVVDLTAITKELYKADNDAAQYFHAATSYSGAKPNEKPSGRDDTHINKYGAKTIAYYLTNAIKESNLALKNSIVTNSLAPCYEVDYPDAINASYLKADVEAFNPANYSARNVTGDWYHTVIGNVGGTDKPEKFTLTHSNGVFTVGNDGNSNGKFDSSGDGFGAIFMQIDKNKNFTASASVKVNAVGTSNPNQSGFGLMLRDDIYIDGEPEGTYTGKEVISTNYVTAGVMGDGSGALFSRENSKLTKPSNSTTVAVGSTYTVSIERLGQVVTVAFNDGTHNHTKTFTDFDFVATDNGYMYLCMFANRGLVVEFSNVQFEITGVSQGA